MKLKNKDFRTIDDAFDMHRGYVLEFSDRTFSEFFEDEFGLDINAEKYRESGTSKAKRLRTFFAIEDEYTVAKVLRGLWEHKTNPPLRPVSAWGKNEVDKDVETLLFALINRIEGGGTVPRTDAIDSFIRNETLEELIAAIERDIHVNKPAAALDRLHTYCMKKVAHLIEKHGGTFRRNEPLNSRFGKYVKLLEKDKPLRDISKRTLKSGISIFESFNDVRNNESFAHDNEIVNQEEARYIFDSISALLRFIKSIEAGKFGE